jgi:hypothetical protein
MTKKNIRHPNFCPQDKFDFVNQKKKALNITNELITLIYLFAKKNKIHLTKFSHILLHD